MVDTLDLYPLHPSPKHENFGFAVVRIAATKVNKAFADKGKTREKSNNNKLESFLQLLMGVAL